MFRYTRLTSKQYSTQRDGEPQPQLVQNMQKTLLDINPEGDLLREIKDIMDELFIMTQIKKQEENVSRTFVKLATSIIQSSTMGDNYIRNRSDSNLPEVRRQRPSLSKEQHSRPSLLLDPTHIEW